jgi:hypothetical protein
MAQIDWRLFLSRDKAASAQLHAREEGATVGEHWGSGKHIPGKALRHSIAFGPHR